LIRRKVSKYRPSGLPDLLGGDEVGLGDHLVPFGEMGMEVGEQNILCEEDVFPVLNYFIRLCP
jgi:hypothetical protein